MAGRPRKPTALHAIDGTTPWAYAATDRKSEPQLIPVTLEAPEDLDETEKSWFSHFAEVVGEMKITTQDDKDALEALACCMARVQSLRSFFRNLRKTDPDDVETYTDMIGTRKVRPEMRVLQDQEHVLLQLLGRFGLTPSDRSRVKDLTKAFGKPDKQDEFA
jgi:phage terminase small subunit